MSQRNATRTQVGIVGCGPAGLFLAHLLHRAGIESVIVENRTREAVEGTIRAGLLEHWVTELMRDMGLGDRMAQEGHAHDGITLQYGATRFHLPLAELTGGKRVTLYPQHEVLIDLIAPRLADGGTIHFGVSETAFQDIDTDRPRITFRHPDGTPDELACDYVVGADGFHGPGRRAIPAADRREYDRTYPFGWLGVLAHAPLSWHELIYARHEEGFALLTTRTPEIQRLYIQCDPRDDIANWPDERIWAALHRRLETAGSWRLAEGQIFQKGIIPLRSFVCETMRHGRLFLAGDAAHIVPPTGAKGLNLAVADVLVLSRALEAAIRRNDESGLDSYPATALRRVWKAERFSWMMTTMLHVDAAESPFEQRIRMADLDFLAGSRNAQAALAENYVGLPLEA
ncbi:4-hydroxybenzoate 3-monooxygenase [Roseomonas populi]|uniref:4-hydroxybenzoate 3-monooxygenase n=1 Tax=Roseomonas populi TaxID=3121582 RepID=A0ABT1X504_9PROT|nr:4-hydroxybenzoate 3-monooxygenase [Roseomonas pecuniae]MCR0982024.1 4-hydroxybenzoate 3-monooxygenase [Roseomonas pecuniae]